MATSEDTLTIAKVKKLMEESKSKKFIPAPDNGNTLVLCDREEGKVSKILVDKIKEF